MPSRWLSCVIFVDKIRKIWYNTVTNNRFGGALCIVPCAAEREPPMKSHRLSNRIFWISAVWFVLCVNAAGAVLFAGAPTLDDGSGFITLSPALDCIVLAALALPALVGMAIPLIRRRVSLPRISNALHYPAAYLALLADASLVLLLLGGLRVLDRFCRWHLPFWGYVGLLIVVYLFFGASCGYHARGRLRWVLLWGSATVGVLGLLCALLAHQIETSDAELLASYPTIILSYTEQMMDTPIGGFLARFNLPASVLMDAYEGAYYDEVHALSKYAMLYLTGITPAVLFFVSWLAGAMVRRLRVIVRWRTREEGKM